MIYKGLYTHKGRTSPIEIHSDSKELTVEIAGLVFKGTEFTDLS